MEEWMRYLKEGFVSDQPKAPGLKEVREKLQYYAMTDAERYAYDEHINAIMIQNDVIGNSRREGVAEGIEIGRAEGLADGRAKGVEEGIALEREANLKKQLSVAQSMLADGLSVEKVMAYTGLTKEQMAMLV